MCMCVEQGKVEGGGATGAAMYGWVERRSLPEGVWPVRQEGGFYDP